MTIAETVEEYEQAIMDAHARGVSPPSLEPPAGYVMTPDFQKWLVDKMRDEVLGAADGVVAAFTSKEDVGADKDQ